MWANRHTICFSFLFLAFIGDSFFLTASPKPYSATDQIRSFLQANPEQRRYIDYINLQRSKIAEACFPAIVNISSKRKVKYSQLSPYDFFFNDFPARSSGYHRKPQERVEKSLGSGFIISADGYILTNLHVIENADEILVVLDNDQELKADLIGSDKKTDVALIKIQGSQLTYLELGNSDSLRLGEEVLALGNPFSVGITLTSGIVSAKGRNNLGITDYDDFIQTDAAINPGNSGGPLLNLKGQVIGMNTAILSRSGGSQGIGLAIPINMVSLIKDSLLKFGEVQRSYLGTYIQDVDPDLSKAFGLNETLKGAVITQVFEGSPAEKAGIRNGDVVIRFGTYDIRSAADLRNRVALTPEGQTVQLELYRHQELMTFPVHLTKKPKKAAPKASPKKVDLLGSMSLKNLNANLREVYDIPSSIKGWVVVDLLKSGKADSFGVQKGDVIQTLNNRPIPSISEFRRLLKRFNPPVALLVYRDGLNYYVLVD